MSSPVQETYGHVGTCPVKAVKMTVIGAPDTEEEADTAGTGQLGKEKLQGNLSRRINIWKDVVKSKEPGSYHLCPVKGLETMDTKRDTRHSQ